MRFTPKQCAADGCSKPAPQARYCNMHRMRLLRRGSLDIGRRQNGTGNINAAGYVDVRVNGIRKYGHVAVAEEALGKPLPVGAVVHHMNEIKSDNRQANLVVCPDEAYHQLLHRRMKAIDACGHADWLKCWICKEYDAPENLIGTKQRAHSRCNSEYCKKQYEARCMRAA